MKFDLVFAVEDEETSGREFTKADLFPLNPTQLGFLSKFWEIQVDSLGIITANISE